MIKIGNINLNSKIVLAPVAGYSDSPFRRVSMRNGAGMVVTELISSEGIVRKNQKTLDMISFNKDEKPFGIQIFGKHPEIMAEAALIVSEMNPDFIDINFGCPAKKVCKNGEGSGAALLLNPEKIREITDSIVKKVTIPVSAKIRTGWDENNLNYPDVIKALEDGGISFISIHGRTKAQAYTGYANWNAITRAKEIASVPVIGNGDIQTYNEAIERLKSSGCDAVMIGRAAFGNPWIFSGKTPSIKELIEQIEEHLDLMIEEFGERGIILMRKHIVKYIHGIKNASLYRKRLVLSTNRDEIFEILNSILLR